MIQRIQSLYLLAATALLAAALCLPTAAFSKEDIELTLTAFRLSDASGAYEESAIWMGILFVLSAALPFATIFLYGHRMLQIRLCGVELVLLVGDTVFIVIYCLLAGRVAGCAGFPFDALRAGAVMPLAAIVPVVLAMRAIFRDELLVRSLDRIR